MGDRTRWQGRPWWSGHQAQTNENAWQQDSNAWQQDSNAWQHHSHASRGRSRKHAAYLQGGGRLIGCPFVEGNHKDGWASSQQRAREVYKPSNADAEQRFPEDQVIRYLWPWSVSDMNWSIYMGPTHESGFWQRFTKEVFEQDGAISHKTTSRVRRYDGGHGNYWLVLCGNNRWTGLGTDTNIGNCGIRAGVRRAFGLLELLSMCVTHPNPK
jgi:hypothetical protein